MTIRELYEWAKEHDCEDYEIRTIHTYGSSAIEEDDIQKYSREKRILV